MMTDLLGLGVIGCGRVFERFHLPALRKSSRWKLSAVCDSDWRRQQWAGRNLPGVPGFDSIDQMLDQIDLDAALIATPPQMHTTLAVKAIQAGLHVLIEKPGGRSLTDAMELARLAAPTDRIIWVGYNRRFIQHYETIRSILGAIPPPASPSARFDLSLSVVDWDSISGYLGEENQGGDVLCDVASHQLDLLSLMFSSPVVSVRPRVWDRNSPTAERLSYDVRLESGVTVQCLAEHGEGYRESLLVEVGTRRLLSYPTGLLKTERGSWRAIKQSAGLRYWIDRKLIRIGMLADPMRRSYHNQLDAFATAVRGGRPRIAGSSVNSLLMTHRAMQTILDSRNSIGGWRTVGNEK